MENQPNYAVLKWSKIARGNPYSALIRALTGKALSQSSIVEIARPDALKPVG